jgi:hypothetical protein
MDDDYRPMTATSDEDVRVAAMLKSQAQAQAPFVPAINTNLQQHPMMRPHPHQRMHPMATSVGGPMIASPTAMSFEDPVLGRVFDSIPYGASVDAYPPGYGPVQDKWASAGGGGYGHGNINHNDQVYLKSLAHSRRSRSSSQSSGSASPPGYYEQVGGWNGNGMMNGANGMNMGMAGMHAGNIGNMGMINVGGGGSTMGNPGVAFATMM